MQRFPCPRRDYPIALVGAGSIVNDAHLPAYRKAGFTVIGIYDLQPERAQKTAARFDIPTVYPDLDTLLSGPATIVDVAVPAQENPAIAERVAQAGKALLLQKPLAEDLAGARAIAAAVERAGIVAAVNQQARWMPAALAMRDLIARGLLGEVYQVSFLNTVRALLRREPRLVFADGATLPGFQTGGETRTVIQLIYDGDLRATVMDNHHNIGGLDDQYVTVRVEGTEGTAVAELGLNKNYPVGAPDSFRYMSRRLQPGTWISPTFSVTWFPDAFIGTMASVMRGLEGQPGAPETSVADDLGTVRIVLAAYKSMAERCAIDPASL